MSTEQRLTARGHRHAEAFCLMWYYCKSCGHCERIWNSRDGVTPFGMGCPSCGGHEMLHTAFNLDTYAPKHKLLPFQKFWRDGTPDEAEAFIRKRIRVYGASADDAQLIAEARAGTLNEFQPGWPMLEVHTGDE